MGLTSVPAATALNTQKARILPAAIDSTASGISEAATLLSGAPELPWEARSPTLTQ